MIVSVPGERANELYVSLGGRGAQTLIVRESLCKTVLTASSLFKFRDSKLMLKEPAG